MIHIYELQSEAHEETKKANKGNRKKGMLGNKKVVIALTISALLSHVRRE